MEENQNQWSWRDVLLLAVLCVGIALLISFSFLAVKEVIDVYYYFMQHLGTIL